jgi:signal transduction histidine kinase/ActR/RegA family two-component response regulator
VDKQVLGSLPIDGPMILRNASADGFVRVNAAFRGKTGFDAEDLAGRPFLDWVDDTDRAAVRAALRGSEERAFLRVHHETRGGGRLALDIQISQDAPDPVLLGRCASLTQSDRPVERVGESTVKGTLDAIARIIERQHAGLRCSILLVSQGRFVHGAGPSLPDEYNAAIDGFAVGPTVGSCGTAIYWNVPVIAENIQQDPLWIPFRELAKSAGVSACWSHPFSASNGKVLGAVALYAPEPRSPTPDQLAALRAAAGMIGLAVDRARAEEALREKQERELDLERQLRQAARMEALGVLAGGIAHDFNNLLMGIMNYVELCRDNLEPDHAICPWLDEIKSDALRTARMTRQLTTFAHRDIVAPQPLNLNSTIANMVSMLQRLLGEDIDLDWRPGRDLWAVKIDPSQVDQIVANLAVNARDAVDGAGTVNVRTANIAVDEATTALRGNAKPGDYVLLTVSDNGCGMDEDMLQSIFDPFYTTKDAQRGSGLGLATVYGITIQNGGFLQVDSVRGEGSTFSIYLPRHRGVVGKEKTPKTVAPSGGDETLLLIEDEKSIRVTTCLFLETAGYTVLAAESPEQALSLSREHHGDIQMVLTDLVLPGMNGIEVARQLQQERPEMGALFMSGYTANVMSERGFKDDALSFMAKPITRDKLLLNVREFLDGRR